MTPLLAVLLGLVARAAEPTSLQAIHELAWDRREPVALASQMPGGSAEERAAVATGLGRLRSEEALMFLEGMRADSDARVRLAVAEALGWTPGSAPVVRAWLAETTATQGLAAGLEAAPRTRAALLRALGAQGEAGDVALLEAALDEPWPTGPAAADGLATLGRRRIEGVQRAAPALVARLGSLDRRVVEAAAHALYRIGLDGAEPALVDAVAARARSVAFPPARAWLVRAVWPGLDLERRGDLFVRAATDPSRLVQAAAFTALQPSDLPADVLVTWAWDPDPWLRAAVIEALGRDGGEVAQQTLAQVAASDPDPWVQADALAALGRPDRARALDPEAPVPVRAALVGLFDDLSILRDVALTDPSAPVRTAAVAALLEHPEADGALAEALLTSSDPTVREVAVELLRLHATPEERAEVLLPHLRVEEQADVLRAGLEALVEAVEQAPGAVDPEDRYLRTVLTRAVTSRSAGTRRAGDRLSDVLGLAPLEGTVPAQRDLVLPSGEVVAVDVGWPALSEARRIRGAVVHTSAGDFTLELDPDTAPLAVASFARLAEAGFYDGVVFHRVVPGFVVQAGCPRGDGWGGPGYTLPDEVSAEGFDTGSLGMARAAHDTGGSQWFVTTSPQPHLDGAYTRFGEVSQGLHVVQRLGRGAVIETIVVERVPPGEAP